MSIYIGWKTVFERTPPSQRGKFIGKKMKRLHPQNALAKTCKRQTNQKKQNKITKYLHKEQTWPRLRRGAL
jgi:hypothetical protein